MTYSYDCSPAYLYLTLAAKCTFHPAQLPALAVRNILFNIQRAWVIIFIAPVAARLILETGTLFDGC